MYTGVYRHGKAGFNPHTHAGCDRFVNCSSDVDIVSIHTPTQGVTQSTVMDGMTDEVSIHTPTQGVTSYCYCGFN